MWFAHDLTRDNMAHFYEAHGRVWDTSIFAASWPTTENYWVLENGERVGILRLSREAQTLYVRDIQVMPAYQGRGAGTYAMAYVGNLAEERGVSRVRLSVFADNRAQLLYRRLGFGEVGRHGELLILERSCGVASG